MNSLIILLCGIIIGTGLLYVVIIIGVAKYISGTITRDKNGDFYINSDKSWNEIKKKEFVVFTIVNDE